MDRREFLQLLPAAAAVGATLPRVLAAAPAPAPAPRRRRARLRAICFDLFTLFDPRSIVKAAEGLVPARAAELCDTWRVRQFEYAWLRVAGGKYVDFEVVTDEALGYAARAHGIELGAETRQKLVAAYSQLELWPDAKAALARWRDAGLELAALANFAPGMIERLVAHGGIASSFDALISTDRARTFKPDPRAYALGMSTLKRAREEIVFAAFGGWDAAGAHWFGYPTFWVNRLGVPGEELDSVPDGTGPTFAELDELIRTW